MQEKKVRRGIFGRFRVGIWHLIIGYSWGIEAPRADLTAPTHPPYAARCRATELPLARSSRETRVPSRRNPPRISLKVKPYFNENQIDFQ